MLWKESIHIQNQEKIKREEILVSRRLYFEKELESLDRDSQKSAASIQIPQMWQLILKDWLSYPNLENSLAEAASINEQTILS